MRQGHPAGAAALQANNPRLQRGAGARPGCDSAPASGVNGRLRHFPSTAPSSSPGGYAATPPPPSVTPLRHLEPLRTSPPPTRNTETPPDKPPAALSTSLPTNLKLFTPISAPPPDSRLRPWTPLPPHSVPFCLQLCLCAVTQPRPYLCSSCQKAPPRTLTCPSASQNSPKPKTPVERSTRLRSSAVSFPGAREVPGSSRQAPVPQKPPNFGGRGWIWRCGETNPATD